MSEAGDRRNYLESMVDVALGSLLDPKNLSSYESDCPGRGLKVSGGRAGGQGKTIISLMITIDNDKPLKR